MHEGQSLVTEVANAVVAFNFLDEVLGTPSARTNSINLSLPDLPHVDPSGLTDRFTKEEVWNTIWALPSSKVPGPDGFTVTSHP
jgi:hypothetical protein